MGSEKAARLRITRGKAALLALCFLGFVLYGMYYNGFGANAEAAMAYFGIDEAQNGAMLTVQSFGCLAVAVRSASSESGSTRCMPWPSASCFWALPGSA